MTRSPKRRQLSLALSRSQKWSTVTLGNLLRAYVKNHDGAKGTISHYKWLISTLENVEVNDRPILDYLLHEIDAKTAQSVHDQLREHVKANGEKARTLGLAAVKLCRAAWRWGRRPVRGLIPGEIGSPWSDVEVKRPLPQVPQVSSEIIREIWQVLNGEVPKVQAQPLEFLKAMALTGLRPWDELIKLQCSQLYRSGSRWAIRLPRHKTVKRTGPHVLGLGDEAAKILVAQRERVGGRGHLWPGLRGKGRMARETVKRAWKRVMAIVEERIDVDPAFYPYCLRHGLATTALEQGVHLTEVQAMLRHASAQTTLTHYAHTAPGLEVVGANKVAAFVVHGAEASIDDLARVVGCDASLVDAISTVKRIANRLGVAELAQAESLMDQFKIHKNTTIADILQAFQRPALPLPDLPGNAGEWSHERFLWACRNAHVIEGPADDGVTRGANALAKAINLARRERDTDARLIDAKTCYRWLAGTHQPATTNLGEIAVLLGVSVDWLLCLAESPSASSGEARAAS